MRRQRGIGESGFGHGSGQAYGQGHDGGSTLRWLLTYADMITLLMAFFIMMYSVSVLNLAKFRQVAFSIRSGFEGPVAAKAINGEFDTATVVPAETAGVPWNKVKELQDYIRSDPKLAGKARMLVDERGLVISLMSDAVIFEAGKAVVRPEALVVMDKIAEIIKQLPNNIRIEGHTCDLPVHTGRFSSNWELSTARSTNVVRYLVEKHGIKPARMSAAGYAGGRPVVPNDSTHHRKMNRRVDIVVIRQDDQQGG